MRITNVSYERFELKLKKPYTIAYEVVSHATNFILKIETNMGLVGYGCAAPDVPVTGETPDDVERLIKEVIQPYLKNINPFTAAKILFELKGIHHVGGSALAMVDMALLDLMSKKADVPLYQFLGGFREKIETSITIGICNVEETLAEAKEFVEQGFRILKIKGGLDVEEDIERMIKIKEQFPQVLLRFDGNQGYSITQAVQFIEATKAAKIEIFEQPMKVSQEKLFGDLVEQIGIPVMADESLKNLKDTYRLVANERVDMINIKLMKVGGIMMANHINSVAKSDTIEVMVGCLDESMLGISAGLHFALSRNNVYFADLDGHLDFINDPFSGLFHLENGWMRPNELPGLGLK